MPLKDPDARREYHKQYMREWYKQNREKHIGYVKSVSQRRRKKFAELLAQLKSGPCGDCGQSFPPEAMDFDHLRDKSFDIGRAAGMSRERLNQELDKCELVCANCHRIRTHARRRGIA